MATKKQPQQKPKPFTKRDMHEALKRVSRPARKRGRGKASS